MKTSEIKNVTAVSGGKTPAGENIVLLLSSLISLLTGTQVKPEEIRMPQIPEITGEDLVYAAENGMAVRYAAHAVPENGKLFCFAGPALFENNHPLSSVRDDFGAVYLNGASTPCLMFCERENSGPYAACDSEGMLSSVFKGIAADIVPEPQLVCPGGGSDCFYLRMTADNEADAAGNIASVFERYGIGIRSLTLKAPEPALTAHVRVFCTLNKTERLILNKALQELSDRQYIDSADTVIPVYEA